MRTEGHCQHILCFNISFVEYFCAYIILIRLFFFILVVRICVYTQTLLVLFSNMKKIHRYDWNSSREIRSKFCDQDHTFQAIKMCKSHSMEQMEIGFDLIWFESLPCETLNMIKILYIKSYRLESYTTYDSLYK